MGILKMLGFDKTIELPQQGDKFVQVFIEFAGFKGLKKAEIEKVVEDVSNILSNTQSVFNKNNECIGCINPYLGINTLTTCENIEGCGIMPISKPFEPTLTKEDNGETKLTFYPMKNKKQTDLYSLPRFHQDAYGIFHACKWISERYSIDDGKMQQEAFLKAQLINGAPAIEKIEGILHLQYLVSERIKNAQIMPELDKIVFAEDIFKTISNLTKDNKNKKLTKEQKEWFDKVEKLIEK